MVRYRGIFFLILFFLLCCLTLWSQDNLQPVAARYTQLLAYSQQQADAFGGNSNPASLAALQQHAAGVYAEQRFMLNGLKSFQAALGLTTRSGNFGLQASQLGSGQLSQGRYSLLYALNLNSKVALGAGFHYLQLTQPAYYGNLGTITASAALMIHATDKIHIGLNAFNPQRAKWHKNGEQRIPSKYSLGLGFDASDKLFVGAELAKEEGYDALVNAGLQYRLAKVFYLRGGFSSGGQGYYAGLGWQPAQFRIDATVSSHPLLGITPGVLVHARFGKKKTETTNP